MSCGFDVASGCEPHKTLVHDETRRHVRGMAPGRGYLPQVHTLAGFTHAGFVMISHTALPLAVPLSGLPGRGSMTISHITLPLAASRLQHPSRSPATAIPSSFSPSSSFLLPPTGPTVHQQAESSCLLGLAHTGKHLLFVIDYDLSASISRRPPRIASRRSANTSKLIFFICYFTICNSSASTSGQLPSVSTSQHPHTTLYQRSPPASASPAVGQGQHECPAVHQDWHSRMSLPQR